jgi:hypothetical protein
MQFKSFMEALKGKQHKIDKNKNGEIDAHDFKLLRKEEQEITEATVKTQKYSWGTMKTIHHGADFSIPLHPENHQEISKLKDEQEHNFKTEDGKSWTARRKGDEVHFQGANGGSSTKVKHADLKESEQRMARADYKVGPSGRKSHKEIVFNDAESKDDDKEEMKEAMSKADVPTYLRKKMGEKPLTMADVKAAPKDSISHPDNLAKARGAVKEDAEELEEGDLTVRTLYNKFANAHVNGNDTKPTEKAITKVHGDVVMGHMKKAAKANAKGDMDGEERHFDNAQTAAKKTDRIGGTVGRGRSEFMRKRREWSEEVEQIDERSDQAKRNKIMKNVMAASKGAQINRGLKLDPAEYGYKRAQNLNVAIGRAAMKAEEVNEEFETEHEYHLRQAAYHEKQGKPERVKYHKDRAAEKKSSHDAYRRATAELERKYRSEEVKKDDVPFDGPYTKTKPAKNSDGTTQQPMSRARALAKDAMKKQMKEDIDRLFEKDEQEYGYEGDMAMNQLATLTRCAEMIKDTLKPDTDLPEWVQSKITLATDYIVTAADYLHSELEEGYYEKPASAYRRKGDEIGGGSHAPVAPVPDRKYIKGTPEHKAYKATKKPINGMPTNVKESFDADGNIINSKVSYKEFAMMLEYETKDGRYVHKGSYGGTYVDPEGADDADDKKVKQQPADKRGRGRPAGAKSGARKITGTSKLFK